MKNSKSIAEKKLDLVLGVGVRRDVIYFIFYANKQNTFTVTTVAKGIGNYRNRTKVFTVIRELYDNRLVRKTSEVTAGGGIVYRTPEGRTAKSIDSLINNLIK